MRRCITIALSLFLVQTAFAQNVIDNILADIEKNNPTLTAMARQAEADKLENHSDIYLANPEIEFAYYWGTPSGIGPRRNLDVKQSFDLATISGARKKEAMAKDNVTDAEFRAGRMEILLYAEKLCIEIAYCNAMNVLISNKVARCKAMADAYAEMLENGRTDRLAYNKAFMNYSAAQAEARRNEAMRRDMIAELTTLNGGNHVPENISLEDRKLFAEDFDVWFAEAAERNPSLQIVRNEVAAAEKGIAMRRMEGLPEITVGYTSEVVPEEGFRGISLGLAIPLWSNKNKIRQARAAHEAATLRELDFNMRFRDEMKRRHDLAIELSASADELRAALNTFGDASLADEALAAGKLSLEAWTFEAEELYAATQTVLEAERDARIAVAELCAPML